MPAFSRYTRRRLERTHGGVLNPHTEGVFRIPSRTTPHKTTQHHNTTQTTQHLRTTMSTHTNTQHTTHNTHIHIHIHIHILIHIHTHTHTTLTPHIPHKNPVHNQQPTVILRRKSECLDMCTDAPPTMILHSIKICNICNVCNFMRTLLFLELISSAKMISDFFLTEMVLELINDLHL